MTQYELDRQAQARELVAKGVALLDEHGPEDWRTRINRELLDINSWTNCILGQVYGECGEGWTALSRASEEALYLCDFGFSDAYVGNYVRKAWLEVLAA